MFYNEKALGYYYLYIIILAHLNFLRQQVLNIN